MKCGTIEYLNVDLEIRSPHDLKPLIDPLFPTLFTLRVGREGKNHLATFQISTLRNSPDGAIAVMIKALQELPPGARQLWDKATDRVFDIGFKLRRGRNRIVWDLRPETVLGVANLRGRIAVTIYPVRGERVAS